MSGLINESIWSASFVTARSHLSASNSHSSQWPSTQIEPRAVAAAEAQGGRKHRTLTSSQPSFGSETQIEPRVVAYEAALALKSKREAAILAAKAPTTEESVTLLTRAWSEAKDARMIIASAHFPDDTSQNSSVMPISHKANHRVTFGVFQQAKDVDLVLRFPPNDDCTAYDTAITCQIIYDPGRDDCLLVNQTGPQLHLTKFSSSPTLQISIRRQKSRSIQPGMWRISIDDEKADSGKYHLAEIWLLRRQFDVSIRTANDSSQRKRGISDDAEENASKRQRRNTASGNAALTQPISRTTMAPMPTTIGSKSTDARNPVLASSVHNISDKTIVSLLELADGQTAVIRALRDKTDKSRSLSGAKGPTSYILRRNEQKGATESASVFACEHSTVPGPVVAKVLRYKRDKIGTTVFLWKAEKSILEKLKHNNIVALKAFDGRMLAMYLESLPASLDRYEVKFSQSDISIILNNISSALVYLKTIPIIHNDIKPSNITYSPERGAVLIDFGLATSNSEFNAGGTPWYLPPDLLSDNTRGSPGDIWALGVTMLYLLGKIPYPEKIGRIWDIRKLDRGENLTPMKDWLRYIFSVRDNLSPVNRGTGISKLESIVFNMLATDSDIRFNAEEIVSALDQPIAAPLLRAA